jgi:hypothetical protein
VSSLFLFIFCFYSNFVCDAEFFQGVPSFWVSCRSSMTFVLPNVEAEVDALRIMTEIAAEDVEVVEVTSTLFNKTLGDVEVKVVDDSVTSVGAVLVGISSIGGENGQV